jgi:hypothetical protein
MAESGNRFMTPAFAVPAAEPETGNRFMTPAFEPPSAARQLVENDSALARTAERVAGAVDVATDIGEGIISGGFSFAEGLAQLPAIGFDAAFNTNTSRAVSNFFEPIQEFVGPERAAGRVAADLTAFGVTFIPFAGWLSRASRAAQLAKTGTAAAKVAGKGPLSRFMRSADAFGRSGTGQRLLSTRMGQYGTTALATGGFALLTSPDGRATLSDSFEVLPDFMQTEPDIGLRGRAEAARLFRNRGKQAIEDTVLSGLFDVTLGALGAGARQVARVPEVAAAANAFNNALASTGQGLARRFPKSVAVAREYFTPTGGADRLLFEEAQSASNQIKNAQREAQGLAADYEQAFAEVLDAAGVSKKNRHAVRQFETEMTKYLEGVSDTLPSVTDPALNKKITGRLDRMKDAVNNHIDRLLFRTESLLDEVSDDSARLQIVQQAAETLKKTRESQGTHLRRVFERYTDPVRFYRNLDLTSPLAKEVQQEVAQNIAAASGKAATDAAIQEQAKAVILDSLGLGRNIATKNVPESQLIKEALRDAKAANRGEGRLGSLMPKESPEFVTDGSLFIAREETLEKSPKLRQLLGEVTDPTQRFVRTVEDIARTTVADEFYSALPALRVERSLMDAVTELNAGGRPAVVTVPDLSPSGMYDEAMQPFAREADRINQTRELQARQLGLPGGMARQPFEKLTAQDVVNDYINVLREKHNYIPLGEASSRDVFGGLYGSASGKFVSPETYSAITQPLRLPHGIFSEILGTLSFLRNVTQKMMIVPNPSAQIRAILGNVGFLAGNANLPTGGDITDLLYSFVATVDELDDAGLERLMRKISLTGVGESNLVMQALKRYKNAADDLRFSGFLNQIFDQAEDATKFMKAFEAVYTNTDTLFKGAALLSEERKIRAAIAVVPGMNEFDPLLLQAFRDNNLLVSPVRPIAGELDPVELMAAEIVRDTMPIYNLVVKAVKALDAVPVVGTFTSFAAENIRNSVGTVLRGTREAAFEAGPALRQQYGDAAMDLFEQRIRGEGIKRLMGYSAMAVIIPKTLVKLSMQATGTTPEQMDALYEANPPFLDGHDLVVLENNRENKFVDYIDLSYVMPYAFMTDAAQAAIREYQEKGRADASTVSAVTQGMWRGFEMYLEPFASETLFFERFMDVWPAERGGRGGRTKTGAEIYGVNESGPSVAASTFKHLIFGFVPNVATMLVEERAGDVRAGRLWRAYTGGPDASGEITNPGKEFARLITGFTPMRLDLKTDPRFMAAEYLPLRADSRTRALRGLKDAAATPSSVVADWNAYLDELYRAQTNLYRRAEALSTLGMTDDEIRYQFIAGGMGRGEAVSIIDGRFDPTGASTETAAAIRNQLNREGRTRLLEEIDFGQLNDLTAARKDEPLRTAPEQRPEVLGPRPLFSPGGPAPTGNRFMQPQFAPRQPSPPVSPNRFMQPQFAPAPVAPPSNRFMQPQFAPPLQQGAAPLSPGLLGDNPVEQAANMQVAQATGRV